jgi:hypothetical protein
MIWKNGARAPALEAAWAADWKTAYLVTRAEIRAEKNGMLEMGYEAGEGSFALTYPSHRCRILETDSTVEQIATHIATTLKAREPAAAFRVRAYEGVHKCAAAEIGNQKPEPDPLIATYNTRNCLSISRRNTPSSVRYSR